MKSVRHLIRDDIRAMSAYQIADIPSGFIKLDAMESPSHPFEGHRVLMQELQAQLASAPIHLYPDPAKSGLQEALRAAFDIPDCAALALGNGSDELIQFVTMLTAKSGAAMLAAEPSFVMYRHNAALYGMDYVGVPLNGDFTLNLPAFLEAVKTRRPALTFIAYPNNPTGVCFARGEVEAVISSSDGIVVVDEAYGAFNGDSFLGQAGRIPNLIVLRTLSKIGFAGLRIGYAAGCPEVIGELQKILPPYNMNQLSLNTAKFALRHYGIISANIGSLKNERERMMAELGGIPQIKAFPSQANFITIRVPDADLLFDTLKQNRILVKKLHGAHPLLEHCLRITVGSPAQNDAVLDVIRRLYR
ncbi:TPA: histidinol-phosphate transaminase [Neisseria lactamica]|uniref:histidinol-phosphate transaminase n=1 Tax=Neisseria lactamica TaxID=486 RepID=UPI000E5681B0|nr:histidinol-phosphate transaminase [Neisseria lactamica]